MLDKQISYKMFESLKELILCEGDLRWVKTELKEIAEKNQCHKQEIDDMFEMLELSNIKLNQ